MPSTPSSPASNWIDFPSRPNKGRGKLWHPSSRASQWTTPPPSPGEGGTGFRCPTMGYNGLQEAGTANCATTLLLGCHSGWKAAIAADCAATVPCNASGQTNHTAGAAVVLG